MMSMPFVLLGSFTAYMYLEVRRARARQQAAPRPGMRPAAARPEPAPAESTEDLVRV